MSIIIILFFFMLFKGKSFANDGLAIALVR